MDMFYETYFMLFRVYQCTITFVYVNGISLATGGAGYASFVNICYAATLGGERKLYICRHLFT